MTRAICAWASGGVPVLLYWVGRADHFIIAPAASNDNGRAFGRPHLRQEVTERDKALAARLVTVAFF